MGRSAAIGIGLALTLAACAAGPTEAERVAARQAYERSIGAPQSTTTVAACVPTDGPAGTDDCVALPETTVAAAPSEPEPVPSPYDPPGQTVEEALAGAPQSVATAVYIAHQRMAEAEAACADPDAWSSAMTEASASVRAVADAAAGEDVTAWRTTGGDDTSAHLRDHLILQLGCTAEDSGIGTLEMLVQAGVATSAYDAVRAEISSATDPAVASDVWYHADQLGHAIEANRLVVAGDPPTVLVAGSSTAQLGLDPAAITEATDRSTMSIALPAATTPALVPWIELMVDRTGADTVVLGISVYEDFRACAPTQATTAQLAESFARQQAAFATVPGLADASPLDRLLGGGAGYADNAVLEAHRRSFGGTRGTITGSDQAPEGLVEQQTETHSSRFVEPQICTALFDDTIVAIDRLSGAGLDVIVVALPLSDDYVSFHPDGRAAFDAVTDQYRQAVEARSLAFLDLTAAVDTASFRDLTHVDFDGRTTVTAAVIDLLEN